MTDTHPDTLDIPTAEFTDERIKLSYWNALVNTHTDVPTPKTHTFDIIPNEQADQLPQLADLDAAVSAVESLGGAAFIRSEYKSASPLLTDGSFINEADADHIRETINELLSAHLMMQMPTGGRVHVREQLSLNWNNYLRELAHPEIRFFIRDGAVVCAHPRMDIRDTQTQNKAEEIVTRDNGMLDSVTERVYEYAQAVAEAFADEAWYSADFVLTTDYDWYLTDMALDAVYKRDGEWLNISAHPADDCPHDLKQQLTHD